jgi:hypothetical protein
VTGEGVDVAVGVGSGSVGVGVVCLLSADVEASMAGVYCSFAALKIIGRLDPGPVAAPYVYPPITYNLSFIAAAPGSNLPVGIEAPNVQSPVVAS